MPVFEVTINSVDGRPSENIEITGTEMPDFTTVKRPTFIELKEKSSIFARRHSIGQKAKSTPSMSYWAMLPIANTD